MFNNYFIKKKEKIIVITFNGRMEYSVNLRN